MTASPNHFQSLQAGFLTFAVAIPTDSMTSAVGAVIQALKVDTLGPSTTDKDLSMNAVDDLDHSRKMLAAVWTGKKSVEVVERPVPKITDPVRIMSSGFAFAHSLFSRCSRLLPVTYVPRSAVSPSASGC